MTRRRSSSKKSFPLPKIHVSGPMAIVCAVILGIAHIGVELYKDFFPILLAPKEMQVCFTPDQGCQSLLLRQINNAKKSIHVQAFSFTDPDVGDALLKAKMRGVNVQIILDQSNKTNKKSLNKMLNRHRIPIRIDAPQGIAHNKIMIIDKQIVITGSYNFSSGAYKRNAENLLVLHDATLAQQYLENWEIRWKKSREEK